MLFDLDHFAFKMMIFFNRFSEIYSVIIILTSFRFYIFFSLALFILTPEESKPKIRIHIKHCLTSTKAILIHGVQKLLCVDAAASDAENLCM